MMNDVKIPKKANFVADSMKPIISKIINKKQNRPRPPSVHRYFIRCDFIKPQIKKSRKKPEKCSPNNAPETERNVCPNIFAVVTFLFSDRQINLQSNQKREKRDGDNGRLQHNSNYKTHRKKNLVDCDEC